jgi:hypothetical protein
MTDELQNKDELDTGRRLARRQMAWISFWFLILASCGILAAILLGNPIVATQAIPAATTAIVGIYTVFTSVILGYLGVSVAENIFKK